MQKCWHSTSRRHRRPRCSRGSSEWTTQVIILDQYGQRDHPCYPNGRHVQHYRLGDFNGRNVYPEESLNIKEFH